MTLWSQFILYCQLLAYFLHSKLLMNIKNAYCSNIITLLVICMLWISPPGSVHLRDFWVKTVNILTWPKQTVVRTSTFQMCCGDLSGYTLSHPYHSNFPYRQTKHLKFLSLIFNSAKWRIWQFHSIVSGSSPTVYWTHHYPFLFLS